VPYIVTTKRVAFPACQPPERDQLVDGGRIYVIHRRAIATLNELELESDESRWVEETSWVDLADAADCFPVPWSHERILDAYNAPQRALE
jgi:hypothetical protein